MNRLTTIFLIILLTSFNIHPQKLTPREIFKKTAPSVVKVNCIDFFNQSSGHGSGVVIDTGGIVATNFHVFEGAKALEVEWEGQTFKNIKIFAIDPMNDLLIMKVYKLPAPPMKFANLEEVVVGDVCYAIGNPKEYNNTITEGLISGERLYTNTQHFQISAGIQHGSSGGAAVNERGELFGITTWSRMLISINLNFAVSIKHLKTMKILCNLNDTSELKKLEKFCFAINYLTFAQNIRKYYSDEEYNKYLQNSIKEFGEYISLENNPDRIFLILLLYYQKTISGVLDDRIMEEMIVQLEKYKGTSKGHKQFIEGMIAYGKKDYLVAYVAFTEALNSEYIIGPDGVKIFENPFYFYFYALACIENKLWPAAIKFMQYAYKYGNSIEAYVWLSEEGYLDY